jgi:hypothetical protein
MEEIIAYVSIGLLLLVAVCFVARNIYNVHSRRTRGSVLPLDGCRLQTDGRETKLESTEVNQRRHRPEVTRGLPQYAQLEALASYDFSQLPKTHATIPSHLRPLPYQYQPTVKASPKGGSERLKQNPKTEKKRQLASAIASFPYKACFKNKPDVYGLCNLDLHGKSLVEGMTILLEYLKLGRQIVAITAGQVKVLVITGWGKHNPNGKSKMKQQTKAHLDKMRIKYSMVSKGCFRISLN